MTVRHQLRRAARVRLLADGRRATVAASIIVDSRADTAAHLTHLIEPAHRIAHDRPSSKVDDRHRVAASGPTGHGRLTVDQETLKSSCNDTVAA